MRGKRMHFGEKLKELRASAGLSQAGLADASGVPVSTIREYEQHKRKPMLEIAAKLAAALGVSLDQFVEGKPAAKKSRRGK